MEKIANFFHQGHHDSNSQENFSHNHHGNHKSPEFQSNPIPPTKIACEDGVLDVCLLGKDTLGVCSYLKKGNNRIRYHWKKTVCIDHAQVSAVLGWDNWRNGIFRFR